MPLHHLKHFLTQPENLKETTAWWCDVLGLEEGSHPDFGFPVKWLYIGDNDVVHMTTGGANVSDARKNYLGQQLEVVNGPGVVDHIAFRCTGLGDTPVRNQTQITLVDRVSGSIVEQCRVCTV